MNLLFSPIFCPFSFIPLCGDFFNSAFQIQSLLLLCLQTFLSSAVPRNPSCSPFRDARFSLISVRFFRKCNTGPHWHSSNPTGSQNMSAAKSLLSLLRWPAGHGGLPSMACLRGVNSVCALSPVCSAAIASYTQFCIPSLYRNTP